MDRVGSEVERAAGAEEVVDSDSELGGEVPDAGVGIGAVVEDVVRRATKGRVLVVGPDEAAATLGPGNDLAVAGAGEIPLEKDGSDGDAGEGSADGVGGGAVSGGCAEAAFELWCVGLPEGEELDAVLEVAVEDTGANVRSEDLAGASAKHEELVAAAVVGDSEASLGEDADGERVACAVEGCRPGGLSLRVSERGGEEQSDRQGLGESSDCLIHSVVLPLEICFSLAEERPPMIGGPLDGG